MRFGVRKKDAPATSEGASNGKFIKYFRKGEKTVRFLEQMDDWTKYFEHFNQAKMRAYPCTQDRETCPGCNSNNEREANASCRFLVNAVDPETGYVDLWKVPVSIIPALERFEDKDDGDITKRQYTVVQFRDGDGVKYGVDRENRDSTPVSDFADKMADHQQALQDAYNEVWGEDPTDSESPVQEPRKREKSKWEEQEESRSKEDRPPFDGDSEEDLDDEDLTEEDLEAMSVDQLKRVFVRGGAKVPKTNNKEKLIAKLIEMFSD